VRRYATWIREEAWRRIGHLYPQIEIEPAMGKERLDLGRYLGKRLKPIAWLWVRTVRSPDPRCSEVEVPLASTYMLCTKPGKEVYIDAIVERNSYRFEVRKGNPDSSTSYRRGCDVRFTSTISILSPLAAGTMLRRNPTAVGSNS
jgi:putative DNA methylase